MNSIKGGSICQQRKRYVRNFLFLTSCSLFSRRTIFIMQNLCRYYNSKVFLLIYNFYYKLPNCLLATTLHFICLATCYFKNFFLNILYTTIIKINNIREIQLSRVSQKRSFHYLALSALMSFIQPAYIFMPSLKRNLICTIWHDS